MTDAEIIADARRKLATAEEIIALSKERGLDAIKIELITALLTPTRKALQDAEIPEGEDE